MSSIINYINFNDDQREELTSFLSMEVSSPYDDYHKFKLEISNRLRANHIPQWFKNICNDIKNDTKKEIYVHYLKNCPIDKDIPVLDIEDPRADKLTKKKTFVAESFMEVFSQLRDTPVFAYETRNHGDFFQDVYPWKKFIDTEGVRSKKELVWHNDRTAHSVRAGYLYLLGLNIPETDVTYTMYLHNSDIQKFLNQEEIEILKQDLYCTDFDPLSKAFNKAYDLSEKHPILEEDDSIRFNGQNTKPLTSAPKEANEALESFKKALDKAPSCSVKIDKAGMLCIPNKIGLHSRKLGENHQDSSINRWLLKTYNFFSSEECSKYAHLFKANQSCLVSELDTSCFKNEDANRDKQMNRTLAHGWQQQ